MEAYQITPDLLVHIALFNELRNAAALRESLVKVSLLPQDSHGNNERAKFDFAFIDAAQVGFLLYTREEPALMLPGRQLTSRLHLLTAIIQAVLAEANGQLRTNTVQSEVLWYLDPGTNVSVSDPLASLCSN
jgi:EKC/KEOPS complex subunit CGI121/TPRKB